MLVKIGNWFFHYRNYLFPIFYLALFAPSPEIFATGNLPYVLGLVIIFLGIMVRVVTIGLVYILRGGRGRKISANELVTEGIYSVCRNPMYLGNILLLLGFGIYANSLLFLVIFFPFFCFIYLAIIKAEEDFLIGRFGEQYIEYKKDTYSIIPKLGRVGKLFGEYSFNLIRVINREYNSVYIYFSGILLLSWYHRLFDYKLFIILFGSLTVIYLIVKYFKRRGAFGL